MTHYEVLKSYNANWKRFRNGKMDFSKYFIRKRAFWSKHSKLKGNEKRKVTCKIKNEPVVEESKKRIYDAIEILMEAKDKITQIKVEKVSGISIATVKKYWNDFKGVVKSHNMKLRGEQKLVSDSLPEKHHKEDLLQVESTISTSESKQHRIAEKKTDFMEIQNIEIIDYNEDTLIMSEYITFSISEKQRQLVFDRICNGIIKRLDEQQAQKLYAKFTEWLNILPQEDIKLLLLDIDDINDSNIFFKQSTIESQFLALINELFQAEVDQMG
jgi:hypothetical protein